MNLRAWCVGLAVSAFCLAGALAQDAPRGGKGRGEHAGKAGGGMEALLSQLNLDEKQQAEVNKLKEELKPEMEKAQGNREAMRPLMQKFWNQVSPILTAEQRQKLQELRAKHGKGRGPGGGGGAAGGGGAEGGKAKQ